MSERRFLTQNEISDLLAATLSGANPERNHCLIMMAYVHGLRATELLTLRLSDLDLTGRSLHVFRMKNGFSTRHPLLVREIKAIRRWLRVRKVLMKALKTDEGWLFVSKKGCPLSRQQFYKILSGAGKKATLTVNPHPHMLRHACGYALADNGVDTRLIQDYLGHRNIRHTVRYTAANAARFEGIWLPVRRRGRQQLEPKC
ncbi:tyrosine-type recombinase/integrase [Salmonella enterica]|uniref:DNA recombinase n=2 Tax=Salmonella enterica TaxID=28901 RepID=A0A5Z8HWG6_SALER|nr:tyrosine-type DNA invertase [Salmonella enterica]EBS4770705.1 DNA recombinase [Salmonella enterica subsp. enterica serovar Sandiego]ECH8236731.1 DNA recombinase [Salmonella enterica subsp. enterica]EIB5178815.1 tyrosine-type recombinase/integrase [Salmonella enterica subsp. enterica serovar Maracaibo]EAB2306355.1 DNA recombinase [Salmonella enterica]EAB3909741.1 DNA recombinase [Salmonella enterica]